MESIGKEREKMSFELDDIWLQENAADGPERAIKRRNYRIAVVMAVGISYLVDTLVLALFVMAGTISMDAPMVYGALGLGHVVLFSLIHYSGLSDRLENPHAAIWQMLYGLGAQLAGMALAPQIMTFFMAVVFIVFAFGVLRIPLRQALLLWLVSCIGILLTLLALPPSGDALGDPTLFERLIIILAFGTVLLRIIVVGYYGMMMRQRMLQYTRLFEAEAHIDALTGAMSRRSILMALREHVTLCRRKGIPFSIALLDVDGFKGVNDRFGHLAGDRVLKEMVGMFQGDIRLSDKVGRYGGEEFLFIFPATTESECHSLVERVRKRVAGHDWQKIAPGLSVTVSCGICEVGSANVDTDPVAHADEALYLAKEKGRNRTERFECESEV